jgi:hypothetical protein
MSEKYGGGLILKNRRKSQPNHPDYTGNEVKFTCPHCHTNLLLAMAMWLKTGKGGGQFFSLAISEPYRPETDGLPREDAPKADAPPTGESNETPPPHNPDNDIPF